LDSYWVVYNNDTRENFDVHCKYGLSIQDLQIYNM
jgi:hypothetical protein